MRNRNQVFTLVMIGLCGFLLVSRQKPASATSLAETKEHFEYCIVLVKYEPNHHWKTQIINADAPDPRPIEADMDSTYDGLATLNKLGAQGWEVVSRDTRNSSYLLKRPKS
jgi:hypothetical protein